MDTLPNEILINILTYLSQRYVITICSTICKKWNQLIFPLYYTTIELYSEKQLEQFIQMAKKKKIKNKRIIYHVKHVIIHFDYKPSITTYLLLFPKLQSVEGLDNDIDSAYFFKSLYLYINEPTDFYYFHDDEQYITKFNNIKNNLKLLNIYMTNELMDFTSFPQQQQQQLETIYMKSIGKVIESRGDETDLNLSIKMLVLPTTSLSNLMKLKIDFFGSLTQHRYYPAPYIIDEQTFENIHQSCPSLESLILENFYMNISNEYHNNNNIIPAHCLKSIDITGGFHHQYCFSYLTTKYSHLESLSLDLWCKRLSSEEIKIYKNAVSNMLFRLPLLKKLTYKDKYEYDEVWPYYEFIKWINQHSNPLTHLIYPFPLTVTKSKELNELNDIDANYIISLQQQQFNFLNHLTSLSIDLDDTVDLAFTFLSKNTNTTFVSTILEELKIKHYSNGRTGIIYFYDWLDVFPNLILYKIEHDGCIVDNSIFFNDYNNGYSYSDGDAISNQLHNLIKERKQQQHQQYDNLNNKNTNHTFYKLKYLEISASILWFKNGFDESIMKCHQLKKLNLSYVTFVNPMIPLNKIHLDLSQSHLELLNISNVFCSPNNDIKNFNGITKLNMHETLTNSRRIIKKDKHENRNQQFSLNLKCKYIDGLTYAFDII